MPESLSLQVCITKAPRLGHAQAYPTSVSDMVHCITRYDPPSILSSSKSSSPVHLRSSRIPVPKPSHHAKVTSILAELGISTSRLVMPAAPNIARLETLQSAAVTVMDMKKNLDRVEQELRILEAQLSTRDSEAPAGEEDGRQQSIELGSSTLAQKFVAVRIFSFMRWTVE